MHTTRTLTGDPRDLLDPAFRIVDFSDESAIITVSTHLRRAWPAQPAPLFPESDKGPRSAALGAFMQKWEAEADAIPQEDDTSTVHTPWRDMVYHQWKHVFHDVMRFLPSAACGIGHFHAPNHEVFPVWFPGSDAKDDDGGVSAREVACRKWDTNVLIIPAYLAPNVEIEVSILDRASLDGGVQAAGEEMEEAIGKFNVVNTAEIWYIRRGVELVFHVGGGDPAGKERNKGGLAAVFAVGVLCSEEHGTECESASDDNLGTVVE